MLPPSIQGMYAHEINFKELFEWLTNYLQKCTAVANCKEYLTIQVLNFKLHEHERIIFQLHSNLYFFAFLKNIVHDIDELKYLKIILVKNNNNNIVAF